MKESASGPGYRTAIHLPIAFSQLFDLILALCIANPRPQSGGDGHIRLSHMDTWALALTMKRLTAWLDRACQPANFVQQRYDGAPFGHAYVCIDPTRQPQTASSNWNRIHLCGCEPDFEPDGLAQWIEMFQRAGVSRFFAWLSPGPEMDTARSWLTQAGFVPRMQWTRYPTLLRESLEPAGFRTGLTVREVGPDEVRAARRELGDIMWNEFEHSAGKSNCYHFMAFDRMRPVAVGALAVFERMGHLTAAATGERDRMRGAQSALIAARIEKARALGCTVLTVETLTMLEHSMRNLHRAGFRVAYEKEVYQWSAESRRSN
jgi:hypothetical protein